MAALTGNSISSTYTSLLKVGDNGTLSASLQAIGDGAGNSAGISLNTGGDLTATGTITANLFSGSGASITNIDAGNIATGTIDSARIPTLNQDTTGNAATATALETSRTIAGVSFDGTANISLTTDNITEGSNEYYTAEKVDDQVNTLVVAGTGIQKTYNDNDGTLTITNSSPDQTVTLTGGTGISTSGTYPDFTITNDNPDQTVVLSSGTGISATGTYPNFTITNTQPDQTVALTAGTGISISGTYPTFTISRTSTDGIGLTDLSATDAGGLGSFSYNNTSGVFTYTGPSDSDVRGLISVTDSGGDGSLAYNNATGVITYTGPSESEVQAHITKTYVDSLGIAASSADILSTPRTINGVNFDGSANISFDTDSVSEGISNLYFTTARFNSSFNGKTTSDLAEGTNLYYENERVDDRVSNLIVASTGLSSVYDDTAGTLTLTNTAPDQTVALTGGTGISTSGTYPNFTITNDSPDQTVSLTEGSNITITGTYPSFTIAAASDTDTTYTLSSETSGSDAIIRLTGSDASTDDVTLAAGSNITITETGDTITLSSESTDQVRVACKNTSGSTITKGTPVYVTGSVGASATVTIAPANAANASTMPASGLLLTDLANNGEGHIVTGGVLKNLITDPIDGVTPSANATLYVKSGGGLTTTKPTGTALIQNVGKVGRVSTTADGSILVSSILRSNDIPNIQQNYFWLGNASGVPTATEHTLSTLTDVTLTSPAAGNLLIYDASNSYFENALLTAGSNVSITNADGSITIASTDTTYSAGTGLSLTGTTLALDAALNNLTDANISTPAAGNLLIYDATNSYFENALLTAGSNVTITNADGAITIAASDTNTTYTAGSGLTLTGTEFSLTNDSVTIGGTSLSLGGSLTATSGSLTIGGNGSTGGVTINDGSIQIRSNTGNVAEMRMYCEVSNAHYQTIKAAPHSASSSAVLVLPTASGDLVGTGDTGSVATAMIADDAVGYAKLGAEYTTSAAISASDVDWSTAAVFTKTLGANTTFTFSNVSTGMTVDLVISGNYTLTLPASVKEITGTYDGTVANLIQIVSTNGSTEQWATISQEA